MAVKPQISFWIVIAIAAVSYGIVFSILSHHAPAPQNIVENQGAQALPPAYFYDVSGKKLSLGDFKGKPVIVNLWATWCPPCVAELPSLDKLQGKLKKQGLVIVPISMDRGDSIAPVEKFLKKQGVMHLSPYWDKDHQIPENWRYDGIPVSFLVSRDGILVKKVEGTYVWDKGTMLKMAEDLSR